MTQPGGQLLAATRLCYGSVTKPRSRHTRFRMSLQPTPLRRSLTVATLAAVSVASMVSPASASPAVTKPTATRPPGSGDGTIRSLQAKRDRVRAEKAKKAAQLDALKATDEQVSQAISDLGDNVAAQTAELSDIQRAQAQAEADAAAAQTQLDQSQKELDTLRLNIRQQAIDAYVTGPREDLWSILSAGDPNDDLNRRTILELRTSNSLDSAERYRAIQEDLTNQRQARTDAAANARARKEEASAKLGSLQDSQSKQQRLQEGVDARLASSLAEADALAAFDAGLSGEITQRQNQIAAQLAAQERFSSAARAALSRAGRSVAGPTNRATPTLSNSGGAGIVNVGGILVAASLAPGLSSLLSAASAAGINLTGGGYRDPSAQIAVRRNNCGSSDFAIYQAPASSCRPPTAPPGTSMHERGLAIDFGANGRTISRGDAAYGWLQANAASYGLYNLPAEPWHWSTNGN